MKTKYKAKYYKKDKETRVSYINLKELTVFRKNYIKVYLERYDKCVVVINTNIIDQTIEVPAYIALLEKNFKEMDILYKIQLLPNTRERKMMGITVGKKKEKAYAVLAELTTVQFESLFDTLFEKVDYMIGFNMNQPFEALVHEFENDYELYLIGHKAFEHTLYDSYVIRSVRTTFKEFPEIEAR